MTRLIVRSAMPCILLLCLSFGHAIAQRVPKYDAPSPAKLSYPELSPFPLKVKTPGHYTSADWARLIDSLWGQGVSTAEKLQIFDTFWNKVHTTWGGFPNLIINWDSLKNVYRPQVEAGVTRGRFYGILSRLTRALCEWHVYAFDPGIDVTMGLTYEDADYPNLPRFHYTPGVPLMDFDFKFRKHFGAGVTSVGDTLALVYRVMPQHPLNLHPGDIILGYDGIPWKTIVQELFVAELPALGGGGAGSTPSAFDHNIMNMVGANWGLFETIDVMKYPGNDIVHLPTSLLKSISPPYPVATEQLPIPGVPFPDLQSNSLVSWGVVEGTTVGYVYAWDWFGVPDGNTKIQFGQAINDLVNTRNVSGLVLDFRTNFGGWEDYANEGFKQLFNIDPTGNYSRAIRTPGNDHFLFTLARAYAPDFFNPTKLFDHPIAVLTGPLCGSAGDYNAFRLRFHPMVRFFGKPTAGAYVDETYDPNFSINTYRYRVDNGSVYSNVNNEGIMIHKAFPVDEEVWLTRDGVAKGEDDVVKRALAWVNNLSYAHDIQLEQTSRDTLQITARVQNPLGHALSVTSFVDPFAKPRIVSLLDDGLHGDSAAGDGLWGGALVPPADAMYHVSMRTEDSTAGTSRSLPEVAQLLFTRGARITVDTRTVDLGPLSWSDSLGTSTFPVRNTGYAADTLSVSLDPGNVVPGTAVSVFPNTFLLAPGDSQKVEFSILTRLLSPSYYGAQVIVESKSAFGQTIFQKNFQFRVVVTSVSGREGLPTEYTLGQNYPNPFNPTTTIRYGLPTRAHATMTVYNTLGQQIALLVNGDMEAGYHEVRFDAARLPSGVYFYRLKVRPLDPAGSGTGDFVQSKKLVLLK